MQLPQKVLDFADEHHGLVTLDVWKDADGSARTFHRARRHGLLPAVCPLVSVVPGHTIGPIQRIAAGVLLFGPDQVVVSHRSAAWMWGAQVVADTPVHLLALARRHRTDREGYVIHRPRNTSLVRVRKRHGLPVTSPLRTVFDLAAIAPVAELVRVIESFLVAGHLTIGSVESTLARYRRSGRPGMAAMDRALAEVRMGVGVPDSVLEAKAAAVFRKAGLGGWEFHAHVAGYEVDFAFRSERVVVEVDGWAVHGAQQRRWERGLDRDLVIQSGGWLVVHLGWRMVTREPGRAAARLGETLATRRPAAHPALR